MYLVIGIIILLFSVQRFGTRIVGKAFGPIMLLWFIALAALGLPWIIQYPKVLLAFSPHYAFDLLANYPHGFWLLGGVFLCTTSKALYSDLGHCGKRNIEYAWAFVKVCLILNYFGQGAWLLSRMAEGNALLERGLALFMKLCPYYSKYPWLP